MTTERPNVSPTGMYSVRQAASALGLHENTLRNWVKEGVFKSSEMGCTRYGRKKAVIRGMGILRVWNSSAFMAK